MEYISWLRGKVGHSRVLIPATAVVVLNPKGEVLLHLRNDSLTWGLPGGLMDLGESVAESARRECREETGLRVRDLKFFGTFSGPRFYNRYAGGDQTAPVILGFYTRSYSGKLTVGPESPELGFFPLSKLPRPLNDFHRQFLAEFRKFQARGYRGPNLI